MVWNFFEAVRAGHVSKPYKFLLSSATPGWAMGFLKTLFDIGPDEIILYDDDKEILHLRHAIGAGLAARQPLISHRMNDFIAYVLDVVRKKARTPSRARTCPSGSSFTRRFRRRWHRLLSTTRR